MTGPERTCQHTEALLSVVLGGGPPGLSSETQIKYNYFFKIRNERKTEKVSK